MGLCWRSGSKLRVCAARRRGFVVSELESGPEPGPELEPGPEPEPEAELYWDMQIGMRVVFGYIVRCCD